jgi:methylenetetrahydrofolate reductase (NADPH)
MAKILNFFERRKTASTGMAPRAASGDLSGMLAGYSIEVMPRTAEKVESFRAILPEGTRVYVAHIDGTPIEDMIRTVKRIADEGFPVMPHLPARSIPNRATLADWLDRYADLGIDQALALGGGRTSPAGAFDCSRQMLETGLFEAKGFRRVHIAGHPEGNRDIDPDGGLRVTLDATRWKQEWARATGVEMAIATQFCFSAEPVVKWCARLEQEGVALPVHIGVAGPAKLQTLIKFAMMCGVGPSVQVLQRRAADISKLMKPFTPEGVLRDLAAHKAANPSFAVEKVHFFPLGGIGKAAEFCDEFGRPAGASAAALA